MPKFKLLFLFLFLFTLSAANAQDSLTGVTGWKVSSQKTSGGKYILHFTGTVRQGAHVYEPNQVLLETKTTELQFADSSIRIDGPYLVSGDTARMRSEIFEQDITVHNKEVSWKVPVFILSLIHI